MPIFVWRKGDPGVKGDAGATGSPGVKGDTGEKGDPGECPDVFEDAVTFEGGIQIGDGITDYTTFDTNGVIDLNGAARVTKGIWLPFNAMKAPGVKPAIFVDHGISGAWQFADGTDNTIVANIRFPFDMDRSVAPILQLGWSTATAVITETAVWQAEYLYTAPGEDTTAAAQDTKTVNSNAIAQSDGMILVEFAPLDVVGATDLCIHMRIKRLGAAVADDLTDTAELHGLCMKYTANKLGTPV